MSKPTAADIERQLEDAIALARRMGFRVAPGEWGISARRLGPADGYTWQPDDPGQPCLCPMACVIMGAPARSAFASEANAAGDKLALAENDVHNFIVGFDACESEAVVGLDGNEFYEMGKRLRTKIMAENGVTP